MESISKDGIVYRIAFRKCHGIKNMRNNLSFPIPSFIFCRCICDETLYPVVAQIIMNIACKNRDAEVDMHVVARSIGIKISRNNVPLSRYGRAFWFRVSSFES